jgi:hypothetical protein
MEPEDAFAFRPQATLGCRGHDDVVSRVSARRALASPERAEASADHLHAYHAISDVDTISIALKKM